jgi:hypothetical protein
MTVYFDKIDLDVDLNMGSGNITTYTNPTTA